MTTSNNTPTPLSKMVLVFFLAAIYGALLTACQSNFSHHPRFQAIQLYIEEQQLPLIHQVNGFAFQGWEALDNRHVTIFSNQGRAYVLTTIHFCNDLSFAQQLVLDQAVSSRLSAQFDAVVVAGQHCRLKSIHQVNQQQRTELLAIAKANR